MMIQMGLEASQLLKVLLKRRQWYVKKSVTLLSGWSTLILNSPASS